MQCPKCSYEPTMAETQRSPNDCVKCGVNYEGFKRAQAGTGRTAAQVVLAPQRVVVADIDMPFGSMVRFMVKWAIATIPAMLILGILAWGAVSFFSLLYVGDVPMRR